MDEQKKISDSDNIEENEVPIEEDHLDLNKEDNSSGSEESKDEDSVKGEEPEVVKKSVRKTAKKPTVKKVVKKKIVKKKVIKRRPKKKKSNWKRPLLIVLVILILTLAIFSISYLTRPKTENNISFITYVQQNFFFINKNSDPVDNIVAFVDGVPITQQQVLEQKDIMSAAVPDLIITDSMALNQTIIRVLLLNSADATGIKVPEDFVDLNIDSVKSRFGSEEDFVAALNAQGITFDEYRQSVVEQVKIDLFVGGEFSNITVSETEIRGIYEQNKEALTALGYNNYTIAKPALEENLIETKQQMLLKELILDLMSESRVVYGPFSDEDLFAVCLSDVDATFYTSYWCGPCASQEEVFGDSFEYVNVVDCSEGLEKGEGQIKACDDVGIEAYPTWVIGNSSYQGIKSIDFLAEKSGCQI